MKLSIITVNYNNVEGLRRTIESVILQTFKDYEWIIIDGGSTDGSKELIEQNQQYFSYWCSEKDKGVYHAMNKGIAKATGEYLNFMNSGDAFHDKEVLASIFGKELYGDILIGQVKCMGTNEIVNNLKEGVSWQRVNDGFCHQGTFSKLKLLKIHSFDENFRIASDWKFWLQTIIIDNASVQDLHRIVACYDMTGLSSAPHNHDLHQKERDIIMETLFPPLILKELYDYSKLRTTSFVSNMIFFEKHHHIVFLVLRKLISLLYRVMHNAK